jgi:hypothetical protein
MGREGADGRQGEQSHDDADHRVAIDGGAEPATLQVHRLHRNTTAFWFIISKFTLHTNQTIVTCDVYDGCGTTSPKFRKVKGRRAQ